MKKRNLAVAMLAAMAMLPVAAPTTQVRAEYVPDHASNNIEYTWVSSAGADGVLDISRQENESEYDYYCRIRETLLSNYTLAPNVPASIEEAVMMGQNKQLNGEMLIRYMVSVIQERSDIHCSITCKLVNGSLGNYGTSRTTEMVNEFGQTQTVPSEEVRCVCDETWREKGIFGAVKLDGTLYAIKIGADAADWATLIPYTDLGCPNCQYDLTWGYAALEKPRYYDAGNSMLGDYPLEVYNSDGSFDYMELASIRWKTKSNPWEVQGVTQYYCENGVITPMTEALHNTLPNNDFITYYPKGMEAEGARRFIE